MKLTGTSVLPSPPLPLILAPVITASAQDRAKARLEQFPRHLKYLK